MRYAEVETQVRRIARRLGERGLVARYFLYDLFGPLFAALLALMLLRKDQRVWR